MVMVRVMVMVMMEAEGREWRGMRSVGEGDKQPRLRLRYISTPVTFMSPLLLLFCLFPSFPFYCTYCY